MRPRDEFGTLHLVAARRSYATFGCRWGQAAHFGGRPAPGVTRGIEDHMVSLANRQPEPAANPLDTLEELVSANNWTFDRHSECELMVQVGGHWCDYHLYVVWDLDVNAMFVSCQLDQRVPETRRAAVFELLVQVNGGLWLGHFDFVQDDATTMYRHAIPMRGAAGLSAEQLEDLVDIAIHECERFYPALQLVVWGGRSVADAIMVARMDTVGEA